MAETHSLSEPRLKVMEYAIVASLLSVVAMVLQQSGSADQQLPMNLLYSLVAMTFWMWILLIRPALDLLRGKPRAYGELRLGAFLTMLASGATAFMGVITLVAPAGVPRELLPSRVALIVISIGLFLVASKLRAAVAASQKVDAESEAETAPRDGVSGGQSCG